MTSRTVSLTRWLEDCTSRFVLLIQNPAGIGFPDTASPSTLNNAIRRSTRVGDLSRALVENPYHNSWRSWQLFADESCTQQISCVPVVVDIDNEVQDYADAYELTRHCLDWIEGAPNRCGFEDLRVIFSGMKGFHIEAKPNQTIDFPSFRAALLDGLTSLGLEPLHEGVPNSFRLGTIDLGHDFIRLTDSFNSWIEGGILKRRKVLQFSLRDFLSFRVQKILELSEAA